MNLLSAIKPRRDPRRSPNPANDGHLKTRHQSDLPGHLNGGGISSVILSYVLTEEKKRQLLMRGRLGWSLGRIEKQTGVRRETAAT